MRLCIDDAEEPRLSERYKDRNVQLLDGGLTAIGHKGWASVFGSHCSRRGKWYYEVIVMEGAKDLRFIGRNPGKGIKIRGHVRVGYACRYQKYALPVGYGDFGYAISDTDGSVINGGIRKPYALPFGAGDVIGCYISLEDPDTVLVDPRKDSKLFGQLQNGILCDPNDPPQKVVNGDSYVAFTINGESLGQCQLKIWDGEYHPAIALYMGATVKVNFGPTFYYEPPSDFKPCCTMERPTMP